MDKYKKFKENRISLDNPFIQRLVAIWRVITRKNFILICYNLEDSKDGLLIKTALTTRTDYNTKTDLLAVKHTEEIIKTMLK